MPAGPAEGNRTASSSGTRWVNRSRRESLLGRPGRRGPEHAFRRRAEDESELVDAVPDEIKERTGAIHRGCEPVSDSSRSPNRKGRWEPWFPAALLMSDFISIGRYARVPSRDFLKKCREPKTVATPTRSGVPGTLWRIGVGHMTYLLSAGRGPPRVC